jgi:hypothetical protein
LPGFFVPVTFIVYCQIADKKTPAISRCKIRSIRQLDGTRLNVVSVDPVKLTRYRQADNRYPKLALRHSQVYVASANIRGGMSIYKDIIA